MGVDEHGVFSAGWFSASMYASTRWKCGRRGGGWRTGRTGGTPTDVRPSRSHGWRTGGMTTDVRPSRVYISVCVCGACLCEYMCCCMHLSWSVSCYLYVCACACVYLCSHAKPANSWEFASNDLQTSGDIVRASARCRKLWLVSSRLTAGKGRGRCRVVDN